MKKFLIYVIVIVTLLFLGFTVYYLSLNDETIQLNISTESAVYLNKGDELELPITWTKPSKSTNINVSVDSSSVLSYDTETKMFKAVNGGFTTVTITPSNIKFGPFAFEVYVGDGAYGSPYVISTAEALANMQSDKYYVLDNDIVLAGNWTPIADFSGNFNGNGHTIYNLKIESTQNAGLFANVLYGGVVENVRFERVEISGEFTNVGAVAGVNNGTIGKVEVIGNIANTNANSNTGLLVGANLKTENYAVVNMCSVKGSLTADGNVGGLVGLNTSSIIVNSRSIVTEVTLANSNSVFGGLVGKNLSSKDGEVYYASAISKAYSVVEKATGANLGAVVGKNEEDNSNNPTWFNKYEDIYYAQGNGLALNAVSVGASLVKKPEYLVAVTTNDLYDIDTYVNFNFATVWLKEESKYAEINFNGTYENVYIKGLKKEISKEDDISLIEFLNSIRTNLNVDSIYTIDEDVTYDLELLGYSNWETIAPSSQNPMNASIRVAEGVTCTIKNLVLSGANNSFFGYLSANSSINGIVFENVELTNTGVNNSAVVATGLMAGATLKDVNVSNLVKFDTTAIVSGVICANNQGNIENCNVYSDNDSLVTLRVGNDSLTFGAIVGRNQGTISLCNVNNVVVETSFNINKDGGYIVGGIAGNTDGNIKNCKVTNFDISSACENLMYVGGIVGYTSSNEITIYGCTASVNIKLGINNQNYVGGIVAYASDNTNITACRFVEGEVKGNNVAGIAGVNYGEISECYTLGVIKGQHIASFVDRHFGTLINCYSLSTLSGETKSSKVCGLVGILGEGSIVDRCFSSAKFEGLGDKFAETESEFRRNGVTVAIRNVLGRSDHYGSMTNCVIINYGDAKVQVTSIFQGKGDFIDANEEQCRGKNDYAIFRENAKFDGSVWNFDNQGEYPTLKVFDTLVNG